VPLVARSGGQSVGAPAVASSSERKRPRLALRVRKRNPCARYGAGMAPSEPLEVVRTYNHAYHARDLNGMLALVDEDCEFVTLHRGVMRGHDAVRAFMDRQKYGVTMVSTKQRYFSGSDTVVVYGVIEWRYVDSGEVAGREDGATMCTVRDGRIVRFAIHEDLASALSAGCLTEADEQIEFESGRPPAL
jgi:ketosteroid isomerase-like protein